MKQKWSRKFVKYFINHGFHLKCDAVLFGEEELPKFLKVILNCRLRLGGFCENFFMMISDFHWKSLKEFLVNCGWLKVK